MSAVSTPVCPPSASRVRPSPERLEAQIRNLSYNQDSVVKNLIEEIKEQRRTNQQLQERFDAERNTWRHEGADRLSEKYEAERQRDDQQRRAEYELRRCVTHVSYRVPAMPVRHYMYVNYCVHVTEDVTLSTALRTHRTHAFVLDLRRKKSVWRNVSDVTVV